MRKDCASAAIILTCAGLVAATSAPTASAATSTGWSAPIKLTGPGSSLVASAGDHTDTEIQTSDALLVSQARADGRFGNPVTVTRPKGTVTLFPQGPPDVDAAGDVALLWAEDNLDTGSHPLDLRYRAAGSTRYRTTVQIGSNAAVASSAMDASGNVLIAWDVLGRGTSTIYLRELMADGHLGSRTTLTQHGYLGNVAVAGDGAAAVDWTVEPSSGAATAEAVTRTSGTGPFGPAVMLAPDAGAPLASVDAQGQALFVWRSPFGRSASQDPTTILSATLQVGTDVVSAPQTLAAAGTADLEAIASGDDAVQLAASPTGNAVVTWRSPDLITTHYARTIYAARRAAGGTFGTPVALTDTSKASGSWSTAVNDAGRTVVSWESGTSGPAVRARIAASISAAFAPVHSVGNSSGDGDPQVAVNASGVIDDVLSTIAVAKNTFSGQVRYVINP